jgi:hypothetical protein
VTAAVAQVRDAVRDARTRGAFLGAAHLVAVSHVLARPIYLYASDADCAALGTGFSRWPRRAPHAAVTRDGSVKYFFLRPYGSFVSASTDGGARVSTATLSAENICVPSMALPWAWTPGHRRLPRPKP